METPENIRTRQIIAFSNLHDIIEKYNCVLSRSFSIDDDPDEMEAEYLMHKERINKNNQIELYAQIFLDVICGMKFLDEKYDLIGSINEQINKANEQKN